MMKKIMKLLVMLITVAMITVMMPQAASGASSADSAGDITVYLTISSDGNFVTGTDGTVMARVPVKIGYFDLKDYGLQSFYRLQADEFRNGGKYLEGGKLVEKPTLLHLYLKALEKYYAGHPLSETDVHSDIINVTGSPTSMYMKNFWGHDENLMYYVDHGYPLMCKGTGSTADYILLEDGMDVDLGMFTDWNFYKEGAFTYFDPEERTIEQGQSVTLTMRATATNAAEDGESSFAGKAMPGEAVRISRDKGKTWQENYAVTDSNGKVELKFDKPGTYYISGGTEISTGAGDNENAHNNGGTAAGTGYTLRTFKNYKFAAPPVSVITVRTASEPQKPAETVKPGITMPSASSASTAAGIRTGRVYSLKAKLKGRRAVLFWKQGGGNCRLTGYQVYMSGKKRSGYKKVATVKSCRVTVRKLLKKHKTCYFRVRGYKKAAGRYKYTGWKYIKVKVR